MFRLGLVVVAFVGCAAKREQTAIFAKPKVLAHARWEAFAPLGYAGDAMRRNIAAGESFEFRDVRVSLVGVQPDPTDASKDKATIALSGGGRAETLTVAEGAALNWGGMHIAVVAIHTRQGELGEGLTEFELSTVRSIPRSIANATTAGDATYRARIPHSITMITLHHSGDPAPMTLQDDPIKKLRELQAFSRNDRNWWDVPYHFIITPDGTIYEGRDSHYMGETNTKYNPWGHLLITAEGNYEIQEPSPAVLDAIEDLMAWAVSEYHIPLSEIRGHFQLADTDCPGKNLKKYLEDGTIVRGVKTRLKMK